MTVVYCSREKMMRLPYRITSTVTALTPHELIEWRHPLGHRWRWKFEPLSPTSTRVTETFDYRDAGPMKPKLKYYESCPDCRIRYSGYVSGWSAHAIAVSTMIASRAPLLG